ncbi:MAG: class I SAM-dependent methyltransferase [Pseudomonadota bacterium]
MLEKIGTAGFETLSTTDTVVLNYLDEVLAENPGPTIYEIGVGIGATTLPMMERLNHQGQAYLFSRQSDLDALTADLRERGFANMNGTWGSPNNTYSGYHFELARAFVEEALPPFDLAYIDGGHVFHLDGPATCILKELCKPGGYMIFDDWYWSLGKSPTLNPTKQPNTARDYDPLQIEASHVQLVCKAFMDRDIRFEFVELAKNTAVYRRLPDDLPLPS